MNFKSYTDAHRPEVCNFILKNTLAQVIDSEFCKIYKNIFSYRTPLVDASAAPFYTSEKEPFEKVINT